MEYEQKQLQPTRQQSGAVRGNGRMTELDLTIRRTTLPLHSFLCKPYELSLYYILDRLPVESNNGVGDLNIMRMLSEILGCSINDAQIAMRSLVGLGLVVGPGIDTNGMESVINFPVSFDFCRRLGNYPIGFGKWLRRRSNGLKIDSITPSMYTEAYKNMIQHTKSLNYKTKDV